MIKIEPKDIDDDLFTYFENTGEYPTDWEQVTFFDEETDLAIVSIDGIFGAINRNGETVIPLIYDHAMLFSEGLLAVKKRDLWGYVDKNHRIMIPFEYDNLYTYGSAVGEEFISNGSLRGVAGYFRGGQTFVRKYDKIGIINAKNEIIFPFIYNDISSSNNQYLCVSFDKLKYGLVNYENNTILPFIYDVLNMNEDNLNFGELSGTILENHDPGVNFLLVRKKKLIKHGIINVLGNIIVPAISATEIRNFIDGKAMCYDYDKQEFFIYETTTNVIIFAPADLQENESESHKVNYIREKMGMGAISY